MIASDPTNKRSCRSGEYRRCLLDENLRGLENARSHLLVCVLLVRCGASGCPDPRLTTGCRRRGQLVAAGHGQAGTLSAAVAIVSKSPDWRVRQPRPRLRCEPLVIHRRRIAQARANDSTPLAVWGQRLAANTCLRELLKP